ncbi:ferritin family protein [Oryzomonas japonica]|uniref:Ferritin family protein n=1 Tax=Oryzomonas japonica TaxID=2603858 RepID=A0A7J4ZP88_9BACT|nr:ferritin family protein [Oryzomonas japonica]KAB0664716.1 ferritin family protein [Oryzomonas japonica]
MNVFDFALKMEEDSKAFYEKLAAETSEPELKSIFSMLAAAEEEHSRAIKAMKKNVTPGSADSKLLENTKNVFQDLLDRKNVLTILKSDPDGYRHAIKFSMAGIMLYEDMAKREAAPATAKILLMLAEEERKHLEIMENIYDFVEAPKDFLAWGEFSNIKEL